MEIRQNNCKIKNMRAFKDREVKPVFIVFSVGEIFYVCRNAGFLWSLLLFWSNKNDEET